MTKLINDWKLQPVSFKTWSDKYALKDQHNNPVDTCINDTVDRVAGALAAQETEHEHWRKAFNNAIRHGAIPAGRILANAGAGNHKRQTSLINCVVSDTINDSMISIMENLKRAALTLKANCGIGYEFSTLRPRKAYVYGGGAYSSGPLSFMDIYSEMASTIASAGGRRGAQMATFDISHPDIYEFIKAKREIGRLRHFNCSVLITDSFLNAVKNNADWPLCFPITERDADRLNIDPNDKEKIIYKRWPDPEPYIQNNQGLTACLIHKHVSAKDLWNTIVQSNYNYDEPGYILIDEVNRMNNLWFCENIRASNPCGEQMLNPNGSCLLGSLNISKMINAPFTRKAKLNTDQLKETTYVFSRMLDNVVDQANLPLPEQILELQTKRRHGMGTMGLDTALYMLNIRYGSSEGIEITEQINHIIMETGLHAALDLAKEKGPAPIMEQKFTLTKEMKNRNPHLKDITPGKKYPGSFLWSLSQYIQSIKEHIPNDLYQELQKIGPRYSHQLSIAPTGTIALTLGNNCSSGIEPTFAHHEIRNIIVPGKKTKQQNLLESAAALEYKKHHKNKTALLPKNFISSNDITPEEHVHMQAAAQKYMDSSISKTANCPPDITINDYASIYKLAAELKLKGCTLYRRDKNSSIGTVLTTPESLNKTTVEFILEDHTTINCKGSDTIEYDGDTHNAANLAEALKEGYYGKL